ncbi:hypothetical protein LCGC14_0766240 [marine sediment metagenome]|uniref:Uncharacterized protein n=1 Tax=marine sediment metagenome TaxID=412755 RepID=A0A0F9T6P7_9ZZZZ|nr:hypothetical protein [archaeon]
MSEEFKTIVDSSYDNGTPLWIYTSDYVYGMVPTAGEKWIEVSYTFEDPDDPFAMGEKGADIAYKLMMEEISKGLSFYVEDLKVPALKEFAEGSGKSGSELIKAVIEEFNSNTANYTANADFLVKSKDELGKLKEKV